MRPVIPYAHEANPGECGPSGNYRDELSNMIWTSLQRFTSDPVSPSIFAKCIEWYGSQHITNDVIKAAHNAVTLLWHSAVLGRSGFIRYERFVDSTPENQLSFGRSKLRRLLKVVFRNRHTIQAYDVAITWKHSLLVIMSTNWPKNGESNSELSYTYA